MQVIVNGNSREVREGTTIAQLLASHDLEPRRVAVEVNAHLVTRRLFDDTPLSQGDHVEIVTLVGGG